MKILYIEDNVIKRSRVRGVLKKAGFMDVEYQSNLADGLNAIAESVETGNKYDVIITDMWYPREADGGEEMCGEELAKTVKEKGYGIPVIVCSNQQYRIDEALGEVLYRDNGDWDEELLIKLIKQAGNM